MTDPKHKELQALLARFGTRLRVLVDQHCGRGQGLDPDDIEQEVRIKLWRTLESDKKVEFPASYIQRVVVTTVVDALRRSENRPMENLDDTDESVVDPTLQPASNPELEARADEWRKRLLAEIDSLPERRRWPVKLAIQGFTADEIARLLGVSVASAQQLSYRGIEELKEKLRARGGEQIDD